MMNPEVTKAMADARVAMTESAFQQAASAVNNAKNAVREKAQEKTFAEMKAILSKLHSGDSVTGQDVALIRAWVVGDAESYTKTENNFQDWLSEYDRLEKTLAEYEGTECSSQDLSRLHGVLQDAARLSYDIANFLEKQDRIKKFDSAVADGLDKDERDLLVSVLTHRLKSPSY